jgi:hypothetical protein
MRDASTLLPHVSEISLPIQQRVEFGRLDELDLVDLAGALGVLIDKLGLAGQHLVYTKDFAADRRIRSLAALTDSITPTAPPFCTCAPTHGSSTIVTSLSFS